MSNNTVVKELDAGIRRIQAVISYRRNLLSTFSDRDKVLSDQIEALQNERKNLHSDFETARETIATERKRIGELQSTRNLLNLKGSGLGKTRKTSVARVEKIADKKERLMAEIAILQAKVAEAQ
jgi:chromosome segregation ATPase